MYFIILLVCQARNATKQQASQKKCIKGLLCSKLWTRGLLTASEYFHWIPGYMGHHLESKSRPTLVFKKSFTFCLAYTSTVSVLEQACSQAVMSYKFSLLSCWLDASSSSQLHLNFPPGMKLTKGLFLSIACCEYFKNDNIPPGYWNTWKLVPS